MPEHGLTLKHGMAAVDLKRQIDAIVMLELASKLNRPRVRQEISQKSCQLGLHVSSEVKEDYTISVPHVWTAAKYMQ